jgi:hypothetical protein
MKVANIQNREFLTNPMEISLLPENDYRRILQFFAFLAA